MRWVLSQLVRFGAPQEILALGKPHLGTDRSPPPASTTLQMTVLQTATLQYLNHFTMPYRLTRRRVPMAGWHAVRWPGWLDPQPLSSEHGTHAIVKAIFWPWLEHSVFGKRLENLSSCYFSRGGRHALFSLIGGGVQFNAASGRGRERERERETVRASERESRWKRVCVSWSV